MKTIKELIVEKDIPVVISDHNGFITYVNKSFEEIFGWNKNEVTGKPLTLIIPKKLHDSHNLGFSRFLTTSMPTLLNKPLNLKAVTKDGREIDSEHIIIAERENGKWVFGATIRPLDKEKQ